MFKLKTSLLLLFASLTAPAAYAKPVDLTGYSCLRTNNLGPQRWDFYGDIAVRNYGDGTPTRFFRVGEGAYEKYSRLDGEWSALYYFFDNGEGIQMRIMSRPGSAVRDDYQRAPWDEAIFPFNAECIPLWELR
ncbi:hypothetical protein BVC71_07250 [Marivivens niveibacter]|uniref:Secreted protein n=1 Tax=Marivivens niveibacter TaxID=1930667 RepID=A0A251WYV8_9RHOB|nr:hypothetical protein BVC71_07250 [Marivivens niveibacter]